MVFTDLVFSLCCFLRRTGYQADHRPGCQLYTYSFMRSRETSLLLGLVLLALVTVEVKLEKEQKEM